MNFEEKTENSQLIYDGRILQLRVDDVILPDGAKSKREYVVHRGGVGILAVVDGEILLVRQFRYPYREEVLEIPAGKLEKGEQPEVCAVRELQEETGYSARSVRKIGVFYPSPGYTDEKLYIYLAEDVTAGIEHLDEGEFLSCERLPLSNALAKISGGEIRDAKTVIAIQSYLLDRLKTK